jgi:hypothetical protein
MWQAVVWACSLVGMSCNSLPSTEIIQAAYNREEAAGSKLHSKDLVVLSSKCHEEASGPFLCEVTFTSAGNANDAVQRLYFDIVAVARTENGWELKSGLCKR